MRIACWSGPRNISTALMRSWSSRSGTYVTDEPLYAYYLSQKKIKHPMYEEILENYSCDYDRIIKYLLSNIPNNKKIWYQKHMAHHLIHFDDISWLKEFNNCILIRHPKEVISSYTKKNSLTNIDDLGYTQQIKIINFLKKNGLKYVVIDSKILLSNPEKILMKWCDELNIKFEKSMLKWKKGPYETDGIWWKHWYNNVNQSTEFFQFERKINKVDKNFNDIYDKSLKLYNKMFSECIK
tara:strand:+ start:394 stop:1110 length:717 start_codon:yes stop_codon:yes gene_type:complete